MNFHPSINSSKWAAKLTIQYSKMNSQPKVHFSGCSFWRKSNWTNSVKNFKLWKKNQIYIVAFVQFPKIKWQTLDQIDRMSRKGKKKSWPGSYLRDGQMLILEQYIQQFPYYNRLIFRFFFFFFFAGNKMMFENEDLLILISY